FPERRMGGNPQAPWALDYFEMSGTSMAAPMVSGAAALMLQQDPTLNPGTVKARLMLSAQKPPVGNPFAVGAGTLDILAALRETEHVADAPSPLVSAAAPNGELEVENPAVLWGNPAFALNQLWSAGVLWTSATQWCQPRVTSSGVVWPQATAAWY